MARNSRSPLDLHKAVLDGYATMTAHEARAVIADDLVLHEPAGLPFGGTYRGPQGFVELMQKILKTFPDFDFKLELILTDGTENILFQGRVSGTAPGGRFNMPVMERWRFENDKAVEILVTWQDTKTIADLMSGGRAKN